MIDENSNHCNIQLNPLHSEWGVSYARESIRSSAGGMTDLSDIIPLSQKNLSRHSIDLRVGFQLFEEHLKLL